METETEIGSESDTSSESEDERMSVRENIKLSLFKSFADICAKYDGKDDYSDVIHLGPERIKVVEDNGAVAKTKAGRRRFWEGKTMKEEKMMQDQKREDSGNSSDNSDNDDIEHSSLSGNENQSHNDGNGGSDSGG